MKKITTPFSLKSLLSLKGITIFLGVLFYGNISLWAQAPGATCSGTGSTGAGTMPVNIGASGSIPSCTGAVTISGINYSNYASTCFTVPGNVKREGWYKFNVATNGQNVTVEATSLTGTTNLALQLFSACGTSIAGSCGNYYNGANAVQTESVTATGLAIGTYYVRVVNAGTVATNMNLLNLCVYATPGNDNCSSPNTITPYGAGVCVNGANTLSGQTTQGATLSFAAVAACNGTGNTVLTAANSANDDVWYKFTALSTTQIINVNPAFSSSPFDPALEVYATNCPGSDVSISCENLNPAGFPESDTLTGLTSGGVYYVRVYDAGTGIPADTTFSINVQTPPANDNCAGATVAPYVLTVNPTCSGGQVFGSDCAATNSGIVSTDGSIPDDDVWFSFSAVGSTSIITVTGQGGLSGFTPEFELFSGTCGALTAIGNCVGLAGPGSTIDSAFATVNGNTYYIRVYDYNLGAPPNSGFSICITEPPANDECVAATVLIPSQDCNPIAGDVAGADQIAPNNTCTGTSTGYNDVWYKFSTAGAATGQEYVITVNGLGGSFQPAFQVLKLTCAGAQVPTGAAGCIAAATQGGIASEVLTVMAGQLVTGANYFIRVYNSTAGVPGSTNFTICVTLPPLNNDCSVFTNGANVVPFTLNPTATCVPTPSPSTALVPGIDGATASGQGLSACGGAANNDVWYTFIANSATTVVTVTGYSGYDPQAVIYSGSCGTTILACTPLSIVNGTASISFTTAIASSYWIRVSDASGTTTNGSTFTICVTTVSPPPPNDNCAGYVNVPVSLSPSCNLINGTVAGATSSEASTAGCGVASPLDVWFYFTAGTTSETVTVNGSSGMRPVFEVFNGGCGVLNGGVSMGCTAAALNGGTATAVISGLTPLTYYFVRVYDYSGTNTTNTFTICVQQAVPATFTCANAIPVLCGASVVGNTLGITSTGPASSCVSENGNTYSGFVNGGLATTGMWYVMIGDGSTVTLSTCNANTQYDTQIDVFTGNCGSLTCLPGASDDNTGAQCCWFYYIYPNVSQTCQWSDYFNYFGTPYYLGLGSATSTFTTSIGTNYYIYVTGNSISSLNHGYTWYVGATPISWTVPMAEQGQFELTITGSPCVAPIIPLPIELVNFTGQAVGIHNLLQWVTATETNNDYFTIEKSADAVNFETLAKVNGAGNSTKEIKYSTYDNNPINGVTYYRLKQTDYNGKFTYSSVISVENENTKGAVTVNNIRPNPTSNNVDFDFYSTTSGKVHIEIFDFTGRLVDDEYQSVSDGNTVLNAKMETLANGVYSLKVTFDKTGLVSVNKVVKQ